MDHKKKDRCDREGERERERYQSTFIQSFHLLTVQVPCSKATYSYSSNKNGENIISASSSFAATAFPSPPPPFFSF